MLKSAYFTNRNQLIDWINSTLHVEMSNIEQLGSGCIYCHILDAAFPHKVPLQKVKWNAYLQIDFIYNFKILQSCFDHLGINKDIDKLVKAKYQDNLEFIQWMKFQFSEQISSNHTYDPVQRRKNAGIILKLNQKMEKAKSSSNLLNCLNKENSNIQNYAETFRASFKAPTTPRNSVGSLTHRASLPNACDKSKAGSSLQNVSDLRQIAKSNRSSKRVHTQSGPLLLCTRLYTDLIIQADEEQCF